MGIRDSELRRSSTSYFSAPETNLDPSLFNGHSLRPEVRSWVLGVVHEFLREHYAFPENWTRLWIAGSGVSYQWSAARSPADLDIMLGIDYIAFRHANPGYGGFSNSDIASGMNDLINTELHPDIAETSFGQSNFDVTVYANNGVGSGPNDILMINPYAAYDVTENEWAVPPDPTPMVKVHPSWDVRVESDKQQALQILRMYDSTLDQVHNAQNSAHRVNAERQFNLVLESASSLYDEIHGGRHAAFSVTGGGYADFTNYRWQKGKSLGVVQAMKNIKDFHESKKQSDDFSAYGIELPDTNTLVRRAMTYRSPY